MFFFIDFGVILWTKKKLILFYRSTRKICMVYIENTVILTLG